MCLYMFSLTFLHQLHQSFLILKWLHYSISVFVPPSLFHYPSTGLNVSELSLTSLPMQRSCFSEMPLSIPSALFLPASLFLLFFLTFSRHLPLSFSHIVIYVSHSLFFLFLSALSLKCLAFSPFVFFVLFCFHLSLSGVQSSLYANNVPVLRKEAA